MGLLFHDQFRVGQDHDGGEETVASAVIGDVSAGHGPDDAGQGVRQDQPPPQGLLDADGLPGIAIPAMPCFDHADPP